MNSFLDLFQGLAVMLASDPVVVTVRLVLVLLGFALVWLGRKGILEPLLMIPTRLRPGLAGAQRHSGTAADDPHGAGHGDDQRLLDVL